MQEGVYPKKKKSVADQFVSVKYSSKTYCWTQKLNKEDYGVDKTWVLLAVVTEKTLLKNKTPCCLHLTNFVV